MKTGLGLSAISIIIILIIFRSFSFSQTKDSSNSRGIVINPLMGYSTINDRNAFIKGIRLGFQYDSSEVGISFEILTTKNNPDYNLITTTDLTISSMDIYFKSYYYLSGHAYFSIKNSVGYYHSSLHHLKIGRFDWCGDTDDFIFTKPEIEFGLFDHKNLHWNMGCSYRLLLCDLDHFLLISPDADRVFRTFSFTLGIKFIIYQ